MIANCRPLALVAGLVCCVGCTGLPAFNPVAPTTPPIPATTLAAWEAVLRAYRADPSRFTPDLFEGRRYFADQPLYLQDTHGSGDRPASAVWLARLVADSIVGGICGYYVTIACWADAPARYLALSEPRPMPGDSLEVELDFMLETRSLCGTAEWSMRQASWNTTAVLIPSDQGFRVARDSVTGIGDDATCTFERLKEQGQADTLRSAIRDSVLDAAMAEVATATLLDAPVRRAPVYLSPFRGFGASDTAQRHDRAWLEAVVRRYHLTGICAGYGSADCPHRGDALYLALTLPHVLPNGLVRLESYRMSVTGHNWGATTTPLFLSRSGGRWSVFCRDVTIFDDGTIGPQK